MNESARLVYIAGEEPYIVEQIKGQIENFGYDAEIFHSFSNLKEACHTNPPQALIIDIGLLMNQLYDSKTMLSIEQALGASLPVIFTSPVEQIEMRLWGV